MGRKDRRKIGNVNAIGDEKKRKWEGMMTKGEKREWEREMNEGRGAMVKRRTRSSKMASRRRLMKEVRGREES